MINISRRSLAAYAVDRLLAGEPTNKLAAKLAAALAANKGGAEVDLLLSDIAEILESRGKLANAKVTSARALSAKLRRAIEAKVKTAAKVDKVALLEEIDPGLIGGFKVETAAHSWDKTIARKLAEIKGGV